MEHAKSSNENDINLKNLFNVNEPVNDEHLIVSLSACADNETAKQCVINRKGNGLLAIISGRCMNVSMI